MFEFFDILFFDTKGVQLQNMELLYPKLSLYWETKKCFSVLSFAIIQLGDKKCPTKIMFIGYKTFRYLEIEVDLN